ncbi:M15 family metallopeptidase [uncultured Shimia sp.]|uniref:M15 family metallopeptidase n=1 Tax=uncultured Shimia sp. TaxID=573152 RepID=UPI00260BCFF2|nr:M15 family metallopeptidase [uncultured Shimia sp.]
MREGTFIGPIIIAIGLLVAAIAFAVVGAVMETADGSAELRMSRSEADIAALERELGDLKKLMSELQEEQARLSEEQALAVARGEASLAGQLEVSASDITGGGDENFGPSIERMTEVGTLDKMAFNQGISQPRNRIMLEVLGHPRSSYTQDCAPVTQEKLKALMETRQVGPIKVTMIRPALASLERIMTKLEATEPEVHAALGTAGALCARLVRGSKRSVSNHSWGTAIDLKLEGRLDGFGDGGTQFGLILLAELFNEEGWYWGAAYNREDSMHFEVGVETLRRWQAEGDL